MPERVWSDTLKLPNALITLHGWTPGTAILNVSVTEGNLAGRTVPVWVSSADMKALADMLLELAGLLTSPK